MIGCQKSTLIRFAALAVVVPGFACGGGETELENQPPVAVDTIPDQTVVAGESWMGSISQYFSDPDNDNLTFTSRSSDIAVATTSMAGANLTVTGVTQGTATITIVATDPDLDSAKQTVKFTVTPANRAPQVTEEIPDLTVTEGQVITIDVALNFHDPDNDQLSYSAESSNTSVVTASTSGTILTFRGVAPGTATVSVTATDPDGLSATLMFEVTVQSN